LLSCVAIAQRGNGRPDAAFSGFARYEGRQAMAEQKNEGEGNWTAAKAYDRDQKKFAESGKVEKAAKEAAQSLERDREELSKAEAEGKRHSHGEDPQVKRQSERT
jgi:hypothetical protein